MLTFVTLDRGIQKLHLRLQLAKRQVSDCGLVRQQNAKPCTGVELTIDKFVISFGQSVPSVTVATNSSLVGNSSSSSVQLEHGVGWLVFLAVLDHFPQ